MLYELLQSSYSVMKLGHKLSHNSLDGWLLVALYICNIYLAQYIMG